MGYADSSEDDSDLGDSSSHTLARHDAPQGKHFGPKCGGLPKRAILSQAIGASTETIITSQTYRVDLAHSHSSEGGREGGGKSRLV